MSYKFVPELIENISNIRGIAAISACSINHLNLHYSAQLFQPLSSKPWAIWLDSADAEHIDSRYDIMVWQPEYTIETKGLISTISDCQTHTITSSTADPLTLLKQLQNAVFKETQLPAEALPFKGGAVGLFAYDLGRRFEKLPNHAKADIEQADMAVGIYSQAVIFDKVKQTFTLVCPSDKQAQLLTEISTLLNSQTPAKEKFSLTAPWQANMDKSQYQEKFAKIQAYLLAGDCYQINLAQRFQTRYQGDEFAAYLHLRQQNKAPFSAFIRLAHSAVLSISPERFLQVHDKNVQTKPIKGTRPRSGEPLEDQAQATELQNANKDRAENLMIVDLLRNDLSRVCQPGSVKVPALFAIESFPAVHHLVSTIVGKLEENYDAIDLLKASFPGGSITGAPKISAMEIIDELEPQRRNIYCGSIGYISACGNMDTSITIRTLICENHQIYCWAGGGIVADSQVDSEYQETLDKVNKILPTLSALP